MSAKGKVNMRVRLYDVALWAGGKYVTIAGHDNNDVQQVVIVDAESLDRMVERARDVADRLQTLAEISIDFCDHDGNHPDDCKDCPDYREHHRAARAYLVETEGET